MKPFLQHHSIKHLLMALLLTSGFWGSYAQAGMISTDAMISKDAMISVQGESYSQADLQAALESEELKSQLHAMGVDVEQLNDRIASLTPSEIQQLNSKLEQQPAGGVLGALLTVFIVFVITDMLCATDLFTFVKCINK